MRLTEYHGRAEANDLSTVLDSQSDEMEHLRTKLTEFMKLSEDWEETRKEKNDLIEDLRNKVVGFEELMKEKEVYENRLKMLEDEVQIEKTKYTER